MCIVCTSTSIELLMAKFVMQKTGLMRVFVFAALTGIYANIGKVLIFRRLLAIFKNLNINSRHSQKKKHLYKPKYFLASRGQCTDVECI